MNMNARMHEFGNIKGGMPSTDYDMYGCGVNMYAEWGTLDVIVQFSVFSHLLYSS